MQYEDACPIGVGRYGKVFKAHVVGTDVCVAIKRMMILDGQGIPQTAIREIAVLQKIQHPNVVRLLDVAATRHDVRLVFEFVDMDLACYMQSVDGRMDPKKIPSRSRRNLCLVSSSATATASCTAI